MRTHWTEESSSTVRERKAGRKEEAEVCARISASYESMAKTCVVLIAVDSSRQAETAFNWYLEHIHKPGNTIVVLHCVDLDAITEHDDVEEFADQTSVRMWDQHKNKIKALDDKYRWKLNENGLPGKIRTESGKPGDVIIQTACQEKAGLIVIGSRGQGKLKRTMSGSVSDYVLHHSKCPVVICTQRD